MQNFFLLAMVKFKSIDFDLIVLILYLPLEFIRDSFDLVGSKLKRYQNNEVCRSRFNSHSRSWCI
jgi:hypothetical protein